MGEVASFEEFKRRRDQEQSGGSEAPADKELLTPVERRTRPWFGLKESEQDAFIELKRHFRSTQIDEGRLQEKRRFVSAWTDEEVLNFVKNPTNISMLADKPHLFFALYERIAGRN